MLFKCKWLDPILSVPDNDREVLIWNGECFEVGVYIDIDKTWKGEHEDLPVIAWTELLDPPIIESPLTKEGSMK